MEKVSSARIALKWGVIYGIVSIVLTTILYNTELWQNKTLSFLLSTLFFFGVLYLSMKEFRTLNGGFMSFKEGLGLGTLTITAGGIISLFFDFFYKKFIDTNILNLQNDMILEQYEKMGMSEEQIDAAMQRVESMNNSGLTFIGGMLFIVLFGFLCSLIMSAVMKKDKPVFS